MTVDKPTTFRIAHNGDEWTGSFYNAVSAVVNDMLHDGPITAAVEVRQQEQGQLDKVTRQEGTLVAIDDHSLIFQDGTTVDRHEDLLAVEF